MIFREALISDIKKIQLVRNAVKENALSDPNLVTDEDCKEYLTVRGKGWVCELNDKIAGFAIVDLKGRNVWALFVRPEHEGKGIGKYLHDLMLDWYFQQTQEKIWLGTGFNTRAVGFYHNLGWIEVGKNGSKEVKFEMTFKDWRLKIPSNKDNSTATLEFKSCSCSAGDALANASKYFSKTIRNFSSVITLFVEYIACQFSSKINKTICTKRTD